MNERKKYLDIMKFIGVCCLFLAHVQGPFILEEIRGFDVTMMVFISGLLSISSMDKIASKKDYIVKRIKRLVIPTWIFLIVFYFCMIMVGQTPIISDVIKSFFFQRDCGLAGGVWIIWVYLVCAIIAPIIYCYISNIYHLFWIIILFIFYEVLIIVMPSLIDVRFIYYTFCTIIPYGLIYTIGMYYHTFKKRTRRNLCICSFIIHFVLMLILFIDNGSYISISNFKYPARLYYLSYGLTISIILIEILKKNENQIWENTLIRFVSKHSLWIYLWQIMILTVINYILKISNYWFLSWIILLGGSFIITWIQNIIVNYIEKKRHVKFLKYFKA